MTIFLKIQKSKFCLSNQLQVTVRDAVNVSMNEVVYNNSGVDKTYLTDGLGTCAAIALFGDGSDFSTTFTHMSSESTEGDDIRKEEILNQMLRYVLKTTPLEKVKMFFSPSAVEEPHLVNFLGQWAKQQKIFYHKISKGGDSAVFNISKTGKALMLATSLKLQEMSTTNAHKKWGGKGVVIDTSCSKTVVNYSSEKNKKHLTKKNTFFSHATLLDSSSEKLFTNLRDNQAPTG